jgi:hypothetical protein
VTDQPLQGRQLPPPRPRVPEPRNPKAHGFQPPATTAEPPEDDSAPAGQAPEPRTPEAHVPPSPRPGSASKRPTTARGVPGDLRKVQIYVDKPIDDYLWQVRAEAAGQRLDVSAAAVARFALHRLMEEMTPTDVLGHLATAPDGQGPGRKRR